MTRRLFWGALLLIWMSLAACQPAPMTAPPAIPTRGATPLPPPLTVYFTFPNSQAADLRGGPDEPLAQAIDAAQVSVDAALYDLDLWRIRDALRRAHRRGVRVRLVAESDHLDRPAFRALQAAGIPIVGDGRRALMHNKFVIIDGYQVWTGSMNLTLNGAYRNDNDWACLTSRRLAEDYIAEFEEMFREHLFGASSPSRTPYPLLTLDGVPVEVYFAPEDHPVRHVLPLIEQAQHSVVFMVFNLTNDDVARLLVAKARQGVDVRGVLDARQAQTSHGNDYAYLRQAGVDVHLDGNPYAMHHKVMVIDEETVIFGSYNFTRSAETRNDENLLIIHDPQVAARFLEEFRRVYAAAQP